MRAREIAKRLSVINTDINNFEESAENSKEQLDFTQFNSVSIVKQLQDMDVTTLTPIEALNKLFELKTEADKL